eukprot:TRINITY_DN108304_c0_g1_i1.p1 TRINITY_DN108304_c0_g1~~TRINITY_DN108304_c0_g1_i1.p1  ORF type:complete len:425 (+),score=89.01 TRINITY_DN108304_c0_g1_i1:58-1332(+)
MAPSKCGEDKSLMERLRTVQRGNQANRRCADCDDKGPTYVCLDFDIFVCQQCSGLHRTFGHRIKGISLSVWSAPEVAKMEDGGNEIAALKFLNRWSQQIFPQPAVGDLEGIREFIRLKYVEKKWFRPLSSSELPKAPPPAAQALSNAAAAAIAFPAFPVATAECAVPGAGKVETFDLLSGLSPQPVINVQEPFEQPSSLIQEVLPSVPDTWSANFAEHLPEVVTPCTGLEDFDFNLDATNTTSAAPVFEEKPATNAAPAISSEAEESLSLGERLRQAVLSGRQEDMRDVFEYCSKPSPKQVAYSDKLAAFAAFDDLCCSDANDTCQPPLQQLPTHTHQPALPQLLTNNWQPALPQLPANNCQPPLHQLSADSWQPPLLQLPEREGSDTTPSTASSPKSAPKLDEPEFSELMTMFNQKMAPELVI